MKSVYVLVALVCMTFGANLEDVINQATADTDTNGDGVISEEEFQNEFIAKWDSDVPSDGALSKHDFVNGWTKYYGDNHHDTATFFDNLDYNGDQFLTVDDIHAHWIILDTDGNNIITTDEFGDFIRKMHPCGQHGHFGCTAN